MKRTILLATLVAFGLAATAQAWVIDPAHTKIRFTAKYLVISDVEGQFNKFDGTFSSSKDDWSDLKAEVTVDVNSINTGVDKRDGHLKSDDFFNAEKYPTITFKSTQLKKISDKKFVIVGDLTIRDVTKRVEFPLVHGGTVTDGYGNVKAGFKATGTIDRQEYGLKYRNSAKTGEAVVSDDIEFMVDAVLIKKS